MSAKRTSFAAFLAVFALGATFGAPSLLAGKRAITQKVSDPKDGSVPPSCDARAGKVTAGASARRSRSIKFEFKNRGPYPSAKSADPRIEITKLGKKSSKQDTYWVWGKGLGDSQIFNISDGFDVVGRSSSKLKGSKVTISFKRRHIGKAKSFLWRYLPCGSLEAGDFMPGGFAPSPDAPVQGSTAPAKFPPKTSGKK